MANYQTHTKFNICIALPIFLLIFFFFLHPPVFGLLLFSLSFVYSTLFMNPDVDISYKIRIFSLRGILTLPFRTYCLFFRHRGLSHSYMYGSFTRIIWLFGSILFVFYLCHKTVPSLQECLSFFHRYKISLSYIFSGICLADWCHLLLDRKRA